jgi:hypothetical protein
MCCWQHHTEEGHGPCLVGSDMHFTFGEIANGGLLRFVNDCHDLLKNVWNL